MTGWQNAPFKIEVKAGDKKFFCMCGKSANAPFCDGSHKGSDISPEKIEFDSDKAVFACGCGQSSRRPLCDGSHKKL
jgi:CDGSH-type Zn-finger protein